MKCAHVYAHEGDYAFKQSDHYFTSSLRNYKRIRLHSKCKDTPYFEPYPVPNNFARMNAGARLICGYFIWQKKKKKKVFWIVQREKKKQNGETMISISNPWSFTVLKS